MSKLQPEECLLSGQPVPTPRIEAMLKREGFYFRPNRGGTSHLRYIHKDFHEQALNVLAGTDKLDTQINAANAVLRVRELRSQKKPSARDLWLRGVAACIDADREDFKITDDGFTVTSHDYPALGVAIPFGVTLAGAEQRLESLRWNVQNFAASLEDLARDYGVETQADPDGVLHVYQTEFRAALNMPPYAARPDQEPLNMLSAWEGVLRERKHAAEPSAALMRKAEELAARWPQDEIKDADGKFLIQDGKLVIRDGQWPEIGMTVCARHADADIDAAHAAMKKTAAAFAAKMEDVKTNYEFTMRRGKRRLYLDHLVYEHAGAIIKRFGRPGDNEAAFAGLDRLESATRARDADFKIDREKYDALRTMSVNFKQTESGGLRVTEGAYYKLGMKRTAPYRVTDTLQGRRSLREEARFANIFLQLQYSDFERSLDNMGYRTQKLEDGTLRAVHAHYEDLGFELKNFDEVRALAATLPALAAEVGALHPGRALGRYLEAQNRIMDEFVNPVGDACRKLFDRFSSLHPEFAALEGRLVGDHLADVNSIRHIRKVQGRNYIMHYRLPSRSGEEPKVPVARILNHKGEEVYIVTEKTLADLRELVARRQRELSETQPPFTRKTAILGTSVLALLPAAAHQDVKGPKSAVLLAGLHHT